MLQYWWICTVCLHIRVITVDAQVTSIYETIYPEDIVFKRSHIGFTGRPTITVIFRALQTKFTLALRKDAGIMHPETMVELIDENNFARAKFRVKRDTLYTGIANGDRSQLVSAAEVRGVWIIHIRSQSDLVCVEPKYWYDHSTNLRSMIVYRGWSSNPGHFDFSKPEPFKKKNERNRMERVVDLELLKVMSSFKGEAEFRSNTAAATAKLVISTSQSQAKMVNIASKHLRFSGKSTIPRDGLAKVDRTHNSRMKKLRIAQTNETTDFIQRDRPRTIDLKNSSTQTVRGSYKKQRKRLKTSAVYQDRNFHPHIPDFTSGGLFDKPRDSAKDSKLYHHIVRNNSSNALSCFQSSLTRGPKTLAHRSFSKHSTNSKQIYRRITSAHHIQARAGRPRNADAKATECELMAVVEFELFKYFNSDPEMTIAALVIVYRYSDMVIRRTRFPGQPPCGITVKQFRIHTNYSVSGNRYNSQGVNNITAQEMLTILRTSTNASEFYGFCLAHLNCRKRFVPPVAGMAYFMDSDGGQWMAGVCGVYFGLEDQPTPSNILITTAASHSYIDLIEYALTVAHEIAHTWGSAHDDGTTDCAEKSHHVMNTRQLPKSRLYDAVFSPCSIIALTKMLRVRRKDCFSRRAQPTAQCGNGRLEASEQCDPGVELLQDPRCCTQTCTFPPHDVVCFYSADPANVSACLTAGSSIQFDETTTCRRGECKAGLCVPSDSTPFAPQLGPTRHGDTKVPPDSGSKLTQGNDGQAASLSITCGLLDYNMRVFVTIGLVLCRIC